MLESMKALHVSWWMLTLIKNAFLMEQFFRFGHPLMEIRYMNSAPFHEVRVEPVIDLIRPARTPSKARNGWTIPILSM